MNVGHPYEEIYMENKNEAKKETQKPQEKGNTQTQPSSGGQQSTGTKEYSGKTQAP